MYEPYGEEKKGLNLKERFAKIKEKISEKFKNVDTKNLKVNKVTVTVIALALLLSIGSITSYVSYTGKFNALKADNEVLQKQKDSCETQLDNSNQQLSVCSSDLQNKQLELDNSKSQLTEMTLNYQTTSSDLTTCNDEKLTLSSDLNSVTEELDVKKDEYNDLEDKFNDLDNDFEEMECNYAKDNCDNMKYYFTDNGELFCCLKNDPEFCTENPDGAEIKEITC